MPEFVSVDSFLQELTQEATLESRGQFTLSIDHAKEKLSEFLLNDAQEYLLKLVQAGVAAGANRLELRSHTTQCTFVMEGAFLSVTDLENILYHLLGNLGQDSHSRCLRHLAIAVNTAITTRATGLSLSSFDGNQGHRVEWSAHGRTLRPWTPRTRKPQVVFHVQRTILESAAQFMHFMGSRDILSMMIGSRQGMDPDRMLLVDRASWCPVPLMLNGRWMARPTPGQSPSGSLAYRQFAYLPREGEDPGVRRFKGTGWSWPWQPHYESPDSALIMAEPRGLLDQRAWEVWWVLDGVVIARSRLQVPKSKVPVTEDNLLRPLRQNRPINSDLSHYYAWAVCSAHGCKTDLTGLSPVSNEFLDQLRRRIEEAILENFAQKPSPSRNSPEV